MMAVDPGVRGVDVPLRAERERADSDRLVSVPMDTGRTAPGQRVDHFQVDKLAHGEDDTRNKLK